MYVIISETNALGNIINMENIVLEIYIICKYFTVLGRWNCNVLNNILLKSKLFETYIYEKYFICKLKKLVILTTYDLKKNV
jgi:hypothetical protein